jgi:hypothetical protein
MRKITRIERVARSAYRPGHAHPADCPLMPQSARTNNCVQFIHADVEERERIDWVCGRCKVVRLRAIPNVATELCERAIR